MSDYEIGRRAKVLKDMSDYLNDPLQQIMLAKDRIERMTERAIEREEQLNLQRQKYYNRVLKRFKMKYSEDPAILEDLSLEAYEQIYEMMFDDASIDEIKNYINLC